MSSKAELDDLLARVSKLEELTVRVEALEKLVKEKDGKIKALETQINEKMKSVVATNSSFPSESWVNVAAKKNAKKSEAQLDIINTMTIEANDRNKRESNVVIFCIPLSNRISAEEKIEDDVNKV